MGEAPKVVSVGPLSGAAVALVVRMIPAGDRERYESEFRAELVTIPAWRRPAEVTSLLLAGPRLRRALQEEPMKTMDATKDWRCAIGQHHWVRVQDDNPENRASAHLECTRCLKIKETTELSPGETARLRNAFGGGG